MSLLNTVRSMARAFILSVMYYEPDKKRISEVFTRHDITSIPKGERVTVIFKRDEITDLGIDPEPIDGNPT